MDSIIAHNSPAGGLLLAIDRANLAPLTRIKYRQAVTGYMAAGGNLTDAAGLAAYAAGLPRSTRGALKAAVKLFADDLAQQAKSAADPGNVAQVQAVIWRAEALTNAIVVGSTKGQKAHTWLAQAEVKRLLDTCDCRGLQGQRDRLVLALLVGAGLRREELAALEFSDISTLPIKGKFRTVLNVTGKGAKDRPIPVSDRLATLLDAWQAVTGPGRVARSIDKGQRLGASLSAPAIFGIVARSGAAIGKADLAPHDLRRTYAQLGYEAGVPITQISRLLGHSSVNTTQRYLCLDLDLSTTVSDFIPL